MTVVKKRSLVVACGWQTQRIADKAENVASASRARRARTGPIRDPRTSIFILDVDTGDVADGVQFAERIYADPECRAVQCDLSYLCRHRKEKECWDEEEDAHARAFIHICTICTTYWYLYGVARQRLPARPPAQLALADGRLETGSDETELGDMHGVIACIRWPQSIGCT